MQYLLLEYLPIAASPCFNRLRSQLNNSVDRYDYCRLSGLFEMILLVINLGFSRVLTGVTCLNHEESTRDIHSRGMFFCAGLLG